MFVQPAGSSEALDRYKITRSLRFRSNSPCYLSKTLTANTAVGGDVSTTYNLTISADTNNYVLYDQAKTAGWNGYSLCTINLTINDGVKVGSTRTTLPALDIRGFPSGVVINVYVGNSVSSGTYVVGAGGAGGQGYDWQRAGGNGEAGGDAIWANSAVNISNKGTIAGGGGGGGAGRANTNVNGSYGYAGGGGGGGAGLVVGSGGAGGTSSYNGSPGSPGTLTTGGNGGNGAGNNAGAGGKGGDLGQAGADGVNNGELNWNGTNYGAGSGGAAGNYVVGSNFVTWSNTGSRLGGSVATTVSKNWTVSFWVKRGKLSNEIGRAHV